MPLRFINPNFHVILIHYPLGVFVLGVFLELFGFLWRTSSLRNAARWMIVLGALLTLPAATSGVAALHDVSAAGISDAQYTMLRWHVIYMGIASLLAVFCAVVGLGASDRGRKILYFPLLLGVLGAWGVMVLGAFNGGETIFRQGTAVTLPVKTAAVTTTLAGPKVEFERDIHPIIAGTCYKCHAGDKHKGNLRLDSVEGIHKGGKNAGADVLVPGNPGKSDLVHRISLSKDDDDVMPPEGKGEHLTRGQVELIKAWVAQGADFGNWKEDTDPAAATTTAQAALKASGGADTAGSSDSVLTSEETHPDLKTAIQNKDYRELMDFYGGGALQQHLILAGFAFAAALLALGLSIRRLHSTSVAKEIPVKITPPIRGEGERRRVAEDEHLLRSFNPRAAVELPPKANAIPSGRIWLLTVLVIAMTAGLGYWMVAGAQHVFTPEGWTTFLGKLKSADPTIKVNRMAAHAILGTSFLALSLICALLAALAPRRPLMLGIFSILLIAVISSQVWVGVLLTFDKDKNDASLLHFQTADEAKAQQEREAASEKAASAAATAPSATSPETAPANP